MIYLPILGALTLAAGTIFQKHLLKGKKISVRKFHLLEFLGIILIMIPFVFFFWRIENEALQIKNILILTGVILISIFANILVYFSMKWEKINNLEPAKMLEPLFVVVLALIFGIFAPELYDKNPKIIVPAIIASLALIFSHIKKHHLKINKYFLAAIGGSVLFALELIISRLILDYYSPITFYFIRCSGVFILSFLILRTKINDVNKKVGLQFLILGAIWVIQRIIVYWGYTKLGVIYTTLVIMLGPILIYAFAKIFLKEKISWRNIIASAIILGCILYAILV